jgi:amino acid adenylation domain-containing protein
VLEDLSVRAAANRCPLFDVALMHVDLHQPLPEVGNDVTLTFERRGGRLHGIAAYSARLFEAATIERFAQHVLLLLGAGLADNRAALADLDMLTAAERRRLLVDLNATAHEYPADRCVHQLFEAQAERAPGGTALVCEGRSLTYRELDERANQLARHLQGLGVVANSLVGIVMNRSIELVVAVLAVLKAGGAYVPFDPTYPRERMTAMLEDVRLKALLTREPLLDRLPEHRPRVICLDRDWQTVAREPVTRPEVRSGPGDLCYVIFTSGSTGRPKATAVYHRGWTNLLHWFVTELGIGPPDRNLVMSSISFDITQRSMAMPLVSGGELHLVPDGYDPELILRAMESGGITLLNCAPSTFYPLIEGARAAASHPILRRLRCLILGGEAISASRLRDWAASPGRTTEIVNVYGAAECSDVSSLYRLHDFDRYCATSVPIGKPIFNHRIHILDEDLRLLPFGVVGEICLAGDGVGRGYVNDAALTARKFVDDPFAAEAGGRLYRTGDLGRHLADGNLEFCGRVDHQVKIRGLRIELGEIETVLRAQSGIKEAVVVAREQAPGDWRLTAYYVAQRPAVVSGVDGVGPADGLEDELRAALGQKLPSYMVPNAFLRLHEMPLTPNGKIDREALPAPAAGGRRAKAGAEPRTPIEQAVADLFASILKVDGVGREDSFFRLGGHSLIATQMIASISETFRVRFAAVEFFARPTVVGIADRVTALLAAQETQAAQGAGALPAEAVTTAAPVGGPAAGSSPS